MPSAEGEICVQQDKTPQAPHGHMCKGGCGRLVNRNIGGMVDDRDENRICSGCEEKDGEEEGDDDENTGRERRAPPAYDELSSHFGVLEAAAEESGNRHAAFYLTKAKMAMIAAHSAKRVRQADMREFVAT